jgi:hypothetical protein
MIDDTAPLTPAGQLLLALDAFYALYHELLPSLTKEQVQLMYRRLDRFAREVDDDASRAPELLERCFP